MSEADLWAVVEEALETHEVCFCNYDTDHDDNCHMTAFLILRTRYEELENRYVSYRNHAIDDYKALMDRNQELIEKLRWLRGAATDVVQYIDHGDL